MLDEQDTLTQHYLNSEFKLACKNGNLSFIKKSLSKKSKFIPPVHIQNSGFQTACEYGHLHLVTFFLSNKQFKNLADYEHCLDIGINTSAFSGNIPITDYILNKNPNHKFDYNHILRVAFDGYTYEVAKDGIDIIKHLMLYSSMKDKYDIHNNNDYCFKTCCERESLDIIQFLIFEFNIPKTCEIEMYIKNEQLNDVVRMFKQRELNQSLHLHTQHLTKPDVKSKV
jgi:ankyrin repeat protein